MDEVVGALVRGVLWLAGQAAKFFAEAIAGQLAENSIKSVKRRFAAWRTRRRSVAQSARASLEKGTPTG